MQVGGTGARPQVHRGQGSVYRWRVRDYGWETHAQLRRRRSPSGGRSPCSAASSRGIRCPHPAVSRGLRHYRRDGVGNVLAGEYRTDVVT